MNDRFAKARRFAMLTGVAVVLTAIIVWIAHRQLTGGSRSTPVRDYADAVFVPDVVTFAPGIHMLGRLSPSVAYVVVTPQGFVLVDSGLEADCSSLLLQLNDLGLELSELRAILLTHAHGDHTLGARRLRDLSGAKIYAGRGDCEVLSSGGPREAFFSTYPMDRFAIHPTQIDVQLRGNEIIEVGETRITALATPGHTPGSMCYAVDRDGLRIMFTGDTISSLRDDLGTYAAYLAPRYRGNARDYRETLLKLRGMPAPDLVLPGHPTDSHVPHSPRLSKTQWHELLDRGIRDMQDLLARFAADGADFLDGQPKKLMPGLHYLGDYGGRAIYVLATPSQRFIFDAPGDEGLTQFVTDGMRHAGIESRPLIAVLMTSCDPPAIAGLASLVRATGCSVVAPDTAHAFLRVVCPEGTEFLSPQELGTKGWFQVNAISLEGRGSRAMAYSFPWEERNVLVSGPIPATPDYHSLAKLAADLRSHSNDPGRYKQSLQLLSRQRPDLWLPVDLTDGQNANLYGTQWQTVIDANLNAIGIPAGMPNSY